MSAKASQIFDQMLLDSHLRLDRIFAMILGIQWLFGIACAVFITPLSWEADASSIHLHVWSAILLGGLITGGPIMMALFYPGRAATRYAISAGQLMFSALLIHLMAGRIEAHFHIFVSLALLAAYRDRMIFVPAVLVTLVDHIVRGYLWPQSVFGEYAIQTWRPFEHGAWVGFEAVSLCFLIRQSLVQFTTVAELQCSLENHRDELQAKVDERTTELMDAKIFLDQVLDSIDAEICVIDENGEIIFVNQRWEEFAAQNGGKAEAVSLGANYLSVCDDATGEFSKDSKRTAEYIRAVRDGAMPAYAGEYPCHSPTEKRWFHLRINSVELSNTRGIALVHIDITETKQAQERAASLAKLVLDSPDEVYVANAETLEFVEVNQGACRNLGYDRETLLGMRAFEVQADITETEAQELVQNISSCKASTTNFETVHRRKDGTTYRCRTSLHKSMLEGEQVVVAFVTDITKQKQLEEKLAQAQKLESVGQLAAGVAHEINTPMQCVFGNVEFLQTSFERLMVLSDHIVELLEQSDLDWSEERKVISDLREEYKFDFLREQTPDAIKEAADASNKVISIIRAMKVMSHPGTTEKASTDIHDMISNVATITRSRWKDVATVDYDFAPDMHAIDVLPAEMCQVFTNLIVNAADAISEKIGDEPAELGTITIATRLESDIVRIAIADSGSGISESDCLRVFDPFFTTKEVGKGTGQGLAITHDVIVNHHSGTIGVESTEGIGTTFEIRIPRFPVTEPKASPAKSVVAAPIAMAKTPLIPNINVE